MAAGVTIKHKRKAGAFANGELAAGEWGLDTTNSIWYFSANGTTVVQSPPLASPAFTGTPTAPTAAADTNTTQIATTAFVMGQVSAAVAGLLDFKGNLDCGANPNYPAASKGDTYYVSVAGKIGGGSGVTVAVGDAVIAKADNAGGTEASVGASWFVLEKNLAGALLAANNLSDVADAATARGNIGAAAASHTHAAGDITSGDLAAARFQTNLKAALEAVSQTFNSTNTTIDGGTI
jgi:hypothetical protein